MSRYYLLSFLLFSPLALCASVWQLFGHQADTPEVWHRPDSLVSLPQEDSISWTDEYTVFTVARSMNDSIAECLWSFAEEDTITAAVLTKGVYLSSTGTLLSRKPRDFSKWRVYAYHSGIHADETKPRTLRLGEQLVFQPDSAQADTLHADIEIEEIAYFNGNVSQHVSNTFQTYLALKYGVTLDFAPYISQSGDTLWHPKDDEYYYRHVSGIGNDTVYGWHGTTSQSKEDSLLFVRVDTLLPNEYILIGDDNGEPIWHQDMDSVYHLQRAWRIRQHVSRPKDISVALHLPVLGIVADSLQMRITDANGTTIQVLSPDSITSDSICRFTLNSPEPTMHLYLSGTNPHPYQLTLHHQSDEQTGNGTTDNIHIDAANRIIAIDGYPDNQVFVLYLYDHVGQFITNIYSTNPIDINTLPSTVFYIEVTANNNIVGAINIPMSIF